MCSYTSSLISSTSVGASRSCSLSMSSLRPDGGARVVRAVDEDGARLAVDRRGDPVEVGPEGAGHERHAHHGAAGQLDVGHVAVVAGLQHDDLVAGPHHGQDGGDDGLRGAGGDGDLAGRVVAAAVHRLDLGGHGLAQRRHARHRRVLVQSLRHRVGDGVHQARVAVEIREALAQVDGAFLGGQGRHDGEDGRAHGGELGLECGSARRVHGVFSRATAEPASPGRRWRPLEGEAAAGRIGGGHIS